jgi:hypothetical protein
MSNYGLPDGVVIVEDECLDHLPDTAMPTGITLPDGRELYEVNEDLWCSHSDGHFERYNPITDLPWQEKIDRIRKIVEDKAYAMVEGTLVDLFSASAIILIYDNLSLKNQLRFLSKSVPKMAEIAFKLVK